MNLKITTIGVYGFNEEAFFRKLLEANVNTFIDIRRRRAVRGSKYAFANSKRLQNRLASLNIEYIYCKNLAPSNKIRQIQKQADSLNKISKSVRSQLSESFINAYKNECLITWNAKSFVESHDLNDKIITLFCVEKEAEACHRSLVAKQLSDDLEMPVINLNP